MFILSEFLYFCQYLFIIFTKNSKIIAPNVWRYTTFQPAHKALRSNAAGWNVAERGVGMSRRRMT
jgi:hypothetical protein